MGNIIFVVACLLAGIAVLYFILQPDYDTSLPSAPEQPECIYRAVPIESGKFVKEMWSCDYNYSCGKWYSYWRRVGDIEYDSAQDVIDAHRKLENHMATEPVYLCEDETDV